MTRADSIRKAEVECAKVKERYKRLWMIEVIIHVTLAIFSFGIWLPFGALLLWWRHKKIQILIAEWHYRQAHLQGLLELREYSKLLASQKMSKVA